MIKGIIHNNRPLIFAVIGWVLGVQEVVALIDTGFTGELKVSPEKAKELGLRVTHTESVKLGDERTVAMSASIALISMENVRSVVNVLISPGMPIIGVGLLKRYGYTLNADFKYDTLNLRKV